VVVGSNGTTLAVAYQEGFTNNVVLGAYSMNGSPGGTTNLGGGSVYAVAGTPAAFVVLANTSGVVSVTVPASAGVLGSASPKVSPASIGCGIQSAKGASDGKGAAFAIDCASGVWFGYVDPALGNPFEISEVAAGATLADIAGGPGGRLGVFWFDGSGHLFGRQAGYASLSGSACAVDGDCASGVCVPKVVGGPKAYSVCQ